MCGDRVPRIQILGDLVSLERFLIPFVLIEHVSVDDPFIRGAVQFGSRPGHSKPRIAVLQAVDDCQVTFSLFDTSDRKQTAPEIVINTVNPRPLFFRFFQIPDCLARPAELEEQGANIIAMVTVLGVQLQCGNTCPASLNAAPLYLAAQMVRSTTPPPAEGMPPS